MPWGRSDRRPRASRDRPEAGRAGRTVSPRSQGQSARAGRPLDFSPRPSLDDASWYRAPAPRGTRRAFAVVSRLWSIVELRAFGCRRPKLLFDLAYRVRSRELARRSSGPRVPIGQRGAATYAARRPWLLANPVCTGVEPRPIMRTPTTTTCRPHMLRARAGATAAAKGAVRSMRRLRRLQAVRTLTPREGG
jgi:hypothetical protein